MIITIDTDNKEVVVKGCDKLIQLRTWVGLLTKLIMKTDQAYDYKVTIEGKDNTIITTTLPDYAYVNVDTTIQPIPG